MISEGSQAWLKLEQNGKLHHQILVNNCVTQRVSHRNPNLAQVPSTRSPYGKECRSLFGVNHMETRRQTIKDWNLDA